MPRDVPLGQTPDSMMPAWPSSCSASLMLRLMPREGATARLSPYGALVLSLMSVLLLEHTAHKNKTWGEACDQLAERAGDASGATGHVSGIGSALWAAPPGAPPRLDQPSHSEAS